MDNCRKGEDPGHFLRFSMVKQNGMEVQGKMETVATSWQLVGRSPSPDKLAACPYDVMHFPFFV